MPRLITEWGDEMKMRLLVLTHKYEAHVKSKENFKDKWTSVLEKMKSEFPALQINSYQAIQIQFERILNDGLEKLQISKEGANLSDLPEEPTDLH